MPKWKQKIILLFLLLFFICSLRLIKVLELTLNWWPRSIRSICSLFLPRQSCRGHLPAKCYSFKPGCRADGGNTGYSVSAELLNLYLHRSQPGLLWLCVQASSVSCGFKQLMPPRSYRLLCSVECSVSHSYHHGLQHWNVSHQHYCCTHAGCRER